MITLLDLKVLLIASLGAMYNRIRGGGVIHLPGETTVPDHKRTQVRRLLYCIAVGIAIMCSHHATPWQVGLGALVVFLTLLTGWGVPVGACGGWENRKLEEFKPLDWLLLPIRWRASGIVNDLTGEVYYENNAMLRLWGTVWLSCHGIFTGFLLYLTTGSVLPILTFGLMGAVYWLVFSLYLWRGRKATEGWEVAEVAFGAISFVGLVL